MFGFGEVRTHLGVVFSDAFELIEDFWLDLWKMDEFSTIWKFSRVLRRGVGIPTQLCRPTPRRGTSTSRRG